MKTKKIIITVAQTGAFHGKDVYKRQLQSIVNISRADEIYEANSWIKENFRTQFTVEELAAQQNMSVSLFHQKFKSAVGMGPLQCQKRLRLTEARRLMLDESKNVTEASAEVGYESCLLYTSRCV